MSRLDPTAKPRSNLRGAWWIVVVVAVFFVLVAVRQLGQVAASRGEPRVGDGENPETYGYDLDALAIDTRWLAATMPKDNLDPLDTPPLLRPEQVDSLNRAERGKYLVPDDRVVGLSVNGAARAYPVRVLDWHEVANDTLGGVPVVVTWHPLSGSAVAFERTVDGRVLELSVTGLVWNSHHVLHDRPSHGAESLWVPLLGRAVGGPHRGAALAPLASALTTWGEWRAAFPGTTVPEPDPGMKEAYKRDPYGNYASGDVVRYPVTRLPPLPEHQRLKDTLAVGASERRGVTFARLHAYRFALQAVGLL